MLGFFCVSKLTRIVVVAQVAALQALQRQHMQAQAATSDGRASFEPNEGRFRAPENYVSNSGGSIHSFTAASPPRLSPR
jgi:hypothetical protein